MFGLGLGVCVRVRAIRVSFRVRAIRVRFMVRVSVSVRV